MNDFRAQITISQETPALRVAVADPQLVEGFLTLDRMAILGLHQPGILVTNHFGAEIFGWQNKDRYRRAILANHLLETSITDPIELETFVRLGIGSRLSTAEKSAIAVAVHRGNTLAIEYNNALAKALSEAGIDSHSLVVCHPREVVADLVRQSDLDEETAQKMRRAWADESKGPDSAHDVAKIH